MPSLTPFSGIPSGSIPGSVFTVPHTLATATVFVNGIAQLPTSYSQSGETFTLTTALKTGETIFVTGWFSADSAVLGSYFPFEARPSGAIPGSTFVVPFNLALATVFRNGLAQLPTSYVQSGTVFDLSTPLVDGETIYISGFYLHV